MTKVQAIWGNGYHKGVGTGIMIGVAVVALLWLFVSLSKEQQPTNRYALA